MEGDRDGVILLRQAGGPTESTFNNLAYRTDTGILFQTDVVWSPDPAHRISCSSGTCDLANGFRPPDRSSSCGDGKVWNNEQGCRDCSEGECLGSELSFPERALCSACRVAVRMTGRTGSRLVGWLNASVATLALSPVPLVRQAASDWAPLGKRSEPGESRLRNLQPDHQSSTGNCCRQCSPGRYSSVDGATACLSCPTGGF